MLSKQKHHKRAVLKRGWAGLVLPVLATLLSFSIAAPAYAASDASFSFSPSSGTYTAGQAVTVTLYATAASADNANAVQANLSFTNLTNPSVSINSSTFALCVPPYNNTSYISGNTIQIPCATTSTFSGTVAVATLSFTAGSAGTATSVSVAAGSVIQSNGVTVSNGTTPSANFTVSAPQTNTGSGGGTGSGSGTGSTGTSSSSKSSTSSSKSSSTSSGSAATSQTSPTPTPTTTTTPSTTTTSPPVTTTAVPPSAGLTITVTDGSGKPISNAKVVVDNQYSEYTNAQGKAGFSGLASGTHTVVITASGKTGSQEKLTLTANNNRQVALKLANSTSPLLVVVYALAGLIVLSGAGFGYTKLSNRVPKLPQLPVAGIVIGSADHPVEYLDDAKTAGVLPISSDVPTAPANPVAPAIPDPTLQQPTVIQPSIPAAPTEPGSPSDPSQSEAVGLPHQPPGSS